jgi:hypothetical protein
MSGDFQSFWRLTNGDTADDFGGTDAPKQRFTFTVKFTLRFGDTTRGSDDMYEMDFGVKTASRPTINISYEDVNYYNFRTKVAIKTENGTGSITFYDDNANKAHDIFKEYLNEVSPVSNIKSGQADIIDLLGQNGAASIGPLDSMQRNGLIKNIRVTHHYNWVYQLYEVSKVHYDYINPKITSMVADELDMTTSEAPTITFVFSYDAVNITYE